MLCYPVIFFAGIVLGVYCIVDLMKKSRPYMYLWILLFIFTSLIGEAAYIIVYKIPEWQEANRQQAEELEAYYSRNQGGKYPLRPKRTATPPRTGYPAEANERFQPSRRDRNDLPQARNGPSKVGPEHYLGLLDSGEHKKAFEILQYEVKEGNARNLRNVAALIGRKFVESSELDKAIECYKIAIAIDKLNEDRFALALLYRRVNQPSVAGIVAEEIIRHGSDQEFENQWTEKARKLIGEINEAPDAPGAS